MYFYGFTLNTITFGGLALAFGLGSKLPVSNIMSIYYTKKFFHINDLIQFDNFQGKIIEITPTAVKIENAQGQIFIPGKIFQEKVFILLNEGLSSKKK